jgi:hypothetical protein
MPHLDRAAVGYEKHPIQRHLTPDLSRDALQGQNGTRLDPVLLSP